MPGFSGSFFCRGRSAQEERAGTRARLKTGACIHGSNDMSVIMEAQEFGWMRRALCWKSSPPASMDMVLNMSLRDLHAVSAQSGAAFCVIVAIPRSGIVNAACGVCAFGYRSFSTKLAPGTPPVQSRARTQSTGKYRVSSGRWSV